LFIEKYEWSMCGVLSAAHFMICQVLRGVTMKKLIQGCAPQQPKNWHGVRACDFFGTNACSPIKFPHGSSDHRKQTSGKAPQRFVMMIIMPFICRNPGIYHVECVRTYVRTYCSSCTYIPPVSYFEPPPHNLFEHLSSIPLSWFVRGTSHHYFLEENLFVSAIKLRGPLLYVRSK